VTKQRSTTAALRRTPPPQKRLAPQAQARTVEILAAVGVGGVLGGRAGVGGVNADGDHNRCSGARGGFANAKGIGGSGWGCVSGGGREGCGSGGGGGRC
jgi:hypothetical protein